MKTFNVTLEQTRRGTIQVRAKTQDEAEDLARRRVREEGLAGASDGCCGVENTTIFLTLEASNV